MERESQKKDCSVFSEMMTEMLFQFDKEGRIFYWNRAAVKLLGYQEGFQEVNITDIFGKVLKIHNGKIRLQENIFIKEEDGCQIIETVAYRKNQTICPVELRLNMQEKRQESFGICAAADRSAQKKAEKEVKKAEKTMEEANQLRNEFVSNVTHELRTPVNGILGFTENLLESELSGEQEESLRIIEHCCHNMMRIINNLLDFSKLEAGKFTIEEKEFRFREFIDKTIETNLTKINDKGLRLMVNISPEIPDYVIGDELRLGQVLNNLISNAVKFTPTGQIIIDAAKTMETEKEMELFFMVMDTGIGISEEEKDKLFKSFSQVDTSITRRFGGTGLGLSISKELVSLMNGEIDVQSEKGKGSTFSFSVRLKKVQSDKGTPEEIYGGWYTYEGLGKVRVEEVDPYAAEEIYRFGSAENRKEMSSVLEKLVICIEMENWQKAENFAGTVKKLITIENQELHRKAFRLELTVRKADKEKSLEQYAELKNALYVCYQSF